MKDKTLLERLSILTSKCKEISERRAQLEGQKTAILASLQKDFGVKSAKEAEDLLQKLSGELDIKENKLAKGVTELEDIISNVK